jgi:hypothetical protein
MGVEMTTKKVTAPPERLMLYPRLLEIVAGVDAKSNFGSA